MVPPVSEGYLYCNLPGLAAKKGDTVRYVLLGMGSEADMHSPVFTGQVRSRCAALCSCCAVLVRHSLTGQLRSRRAARQAAGK